MDTVTYLDTDVKSLLHEHFVCVKLNQKTSVSDIVQTMRPARLLWTPTLVFLDPHQIEVRRLVGFLPAYEFLAELHFVLGMVDILQMRHAQAVERLQHLAGQFAQAPVAAEALFWAGVAAFRHHGKDKDVLQRQWAQLHACYPQSMWWRRADVFGNAS